MTPQMTAPPSSNSVQGQKCGKKHVCPGIIGAYIRIYYVLEDVYVYCVPYYQESRQTSESCRQLVLKKTYGILNRKSFVAWLLALHEEAKHSNGFHSKQENRRHTTNRLKLSMTSFIICLHSWYIIFFWGGRNNISKHHTPATTYHLIEHPYPLPPLPISEDKSIPKNFISQIHPQHIAALSSLPRAYNRSDSPSESRWNSWEQFETHWPMDVFSMIFGNSLTGGVGCWTAVAMQMYLRDQHLACVKHHVNTEIN